MNTVLVTVDALRADHVGYHGYDRPTTPTLDAFADRHTRFTNAFANGTFTSAALPAILTGSLRKDSTDPTTIAKNLQIRAPNVASVLRDAGVHTVGINTNLLFYVWYESVEGFDEFDQFVPVDERDDENDEEDQAQPLLKRVGRPIVEALGVKPKARKLYDRFQDAEDLRSTTYHDAAAVTDRVVEWLDEWAGGQFFLWVHYMDPHEPYGYLDSLHEDPFVDTPLEDDFTPAEIEEIAKRARQEPQTISQQERGLLMDLYDGYVRFFDDELGRLFDELRRREIYQDTQIVVTADHGEEFGEHGMYYHHNRPYDELVHVPLLVKSPVVGDGERDELVRHIDIAPTIAEGHGVPETRFDGRSLGPDEGDREIVTLGSDRPYFDVSSRPFAAYRTREWKLVHHHENDDELYRLPDDPGEQCNVIEAHPETARRLREELSCHIRISDVDAPEGEPLTDENESIERRLRELGYLS